MDAFQRFEAVMADENKRFLRELSYQDMRGREAEFIRHIMFHFKEVGCLARGYGGEPAYLPDDWEIEKCVKAMMADTNATEEQQQERRHAALMRRYERA